MAKKPKANTDFGETVFTQDQFEPAATKTVTNMGSVEGLVLFPAPTVPLATVTLQTKDYHDVLVAPDYSGKASDLKTRRVIVEASLTQNGEYVNKIAKGDLSILQKSGFPISKNPVNKPVLTKTVVDATVPDSMAGALDLIITGAKGARGFLAFITLFSNAETDIFKWTMYWIPKRRYTVTGLESGKTKIVTVGLGTNPTLIVSDQIIRTVQ